MSVAKSLNESQVEQIRNWADDGIGLSEIQRRLADEMEVRVTYMEVRFLLDDLGIELKAEAPPEEEKEEEADEVVEESEVPEAEAEALPPEGEDPMAPAGDDDVTVTISELQRPGAIVSGKVTFSNGKSADWWMDQMGRLGMNADDPEYRPTEADMMAFQRELQRVAQQRGF